MKKPSDTPNNILPQGTVDLVQSYLLNCQRRGLSPATLRWYGFFLRNFAKTYPELPQSPEPIEEFIYSHKTGDERRYGAFRCLRAFYNFVESRIFIEHKINFDNPFQRIIPPRRQPKEKWSLNLDELKRLLEYPEHDPIIRTLLYLLADTGVRIGEATSITDGDIGSDSVKVRGKTGERIVPVSAKVREMLLKLGPGKLFPHKTHWWSMEISRAFKEVGLPGTAHSLRHTYCSLFSGTDQSLMTITGHRSFQMLQHYNHRKLEKAKVEHLEHGPLAQIYGTEGEAKVTPEVTTQVTPDSSLYQALIELARETGELRERLRHNGNGNNQPNPLMWPALYSENGEGGLASPFNILQIMPANGWKAVYALESEDDEPSIFRKPLTCFALIEQLYDNPYGGRDLGRAVEGFDACPDGGVSTVENVGNFLGYEAPGENDDEVFAEAWEYWKEKV